MQIEYIVSADGINVKVEGVTGPFCKVVTQALEAQGIVVTSELQPEFYAQEDVQIEQTQNISV